ncbi:MAG: undecaprenyl/decaprenyl-phosphate alpha-N-acetylglucosaminyl 1-phosphate transferase, partial [Oscillospiraceae bacterium]|nr:undecaprenyl/decaprenyl-phosphate alpha-N-acetylglucosaminyl 1-phosphate transferase [Oscillospiraceae bacterium]
QAVATLYLISAVLGVCAVMIISNGPLKMILFLTALLVTAYTVARIARYPHEHKKDSLNTKDHTHSEKEDS